MDENSGIRVEIENIKSDISELKEKYNQHDKTINKLNESNIELRLYVKQIFEKIDEIKAMILKDKEEEKQESESHIDDRLDKFINMMIEVFQNNNKSQNEIKFYRTKQFWVVLGSLITAISGIVIAIVS